MIPRTVHLIWFGPPPDQYLLDCVQSFKDYHPDWNIEYWDEERVLELGMQNEDIFKDASNLVVKDTVYQLQSDIARYEILHRFGGLYADWDLKWQKPIDGFLDGTRLFTAWEQQLRWVANTVIAAEERHPALKRMVEAIPNRVNSRKPGWRANRITGPHVWTPIALQYQARIADQKYFCPVPWTHPEWADTREYPEAVAVHHWNHQREIRPVKKARPRGGVRH